MSNSDLINWSNISAVPRHVAVIMDGNNRWAKKKMLGGIAGHRAGARAVRTTVEVCARQGVEVLTLFAFSSENWKRPAQEVEGLMDLFLWALKKEYKRLKKNNIRLRIVGGRSQFSSEIQERIRFVEEQTAEATGMTLVVAANYGGRWDIAEACRHLATKVAAGEMSVDDIDEHAISQHVSLADLPEPDLLIRTAGEQRLSNFLLWQCAYSEFYFAPELWPDFDEGSIFRAFEAFNYRDRRFGGRPNK